MSEQFIQDNPNFKCSFQAPVYRWAYSFNGDWNGLVVNCQCKPPNLFRRFMMKHCLNIHIKILEN